MPNIVINHQDSLGNISSISFPQLVQILSFLKKKWENSLRLCGYNPCLHEDLRKIVEVIRRGWFDMTLVLPSHWLLWENIPTNINTFEITVTDVNAFWNETLTSFRDVWDTIFLEFEIPSDIASYKKISEIIKKYNIGNIRFSIHHPQYWKEKTHSYNKDFGKLLFDFIIEHHDIVEITMNCWISKDIFSWEDQKSLSEIGFIWDEGCFGYVGNYDIYPNWEIKKCSSLKELYGKDWLKLDNFESDPELFDAIELQPSISGCLAEKPLQVREKKPFDDHPGFYEEDNRKNRVSFRTTKELIEKKNAIVLPPEMIRWKTILDLGSCIWAMWQWALFYGAKSYTWVELQETYVETARKLLAHHGEKAKIIQSSLENFLCNNTEKFDIVLCLWVIYVTTDYYSILKSICNICTDYTVIESFYPDKYYLQSDFEWVQFVEEFGINLANVDATLVWRGTKISPNWLIFLMDWFWMKSRREIIKPRKIYQWKDLYRQDWIGRYMMRFYKSDETTLSITEKLERGIIDRVKYWKEEEEQQKWVSWVKQWSRWEFNKTIAWEFYSHAKNHIQSYEEIIKLCIDIIQKYFPSRKSRILEFGSAIGYTLEKLDQSWYKNILWIEKSEAMYANSALKDKVQVRDGLIEKDGMFQAILANWTLHFIQVQERENIIQSFFDHLDTGWILIITDKVTSSSLAHELYLDFKRWNWLSETEIENKTKSLNGVLFPLDIEWYSKTVKKIWYHSIDIIHASPSFVTFLIQK